MSEEVALNREMVKAAESNERLRHLVATVPVNPPFIPPESHSGVIDPIDEAIAYAQYCRDLQEVMVERRLSTAYRIVTDELTHLLLTSAATVQFQQYAALRFAHAYMIGRETSSSPILPWLTDSRTNSLGGVYDPLRTRYLERAAFIEFTQESRQFDTMIRKYSPFVPRAELRLLGIGALWPIAYRHKHNGASLALR